MLQVKLKLPKSLHNIRTDVLRRSIILRIFLISGLRKASFLYQLPDLPRNPQRVFLFQLGWDCEKLQHMLNYHGKLLILKSVAK